MAEAVADALEARSHLLVEAGTGVGKSFAYLVPAIARILAKGETVVVATNTIALQEQLVEKDIPLLAATLDGSIEGWSGELKPVLVKGRGNYLSIRRLKLASERAESLLRDHEARVSLQVIEDWAYTTSDGTLSTRPALGRDEVWDFVRSDADNCMGRKCPTFQTCFYQKARRAAETANLLICNHALFFSDLALRQDGAGILPRYDHVILDEAHHVEDVASEHFGVSVGEGRVGHLLRTLYDTRRRRGYLANLLTMLSGAEASEGVESAVRCAISAGMASNRFFEDWTTLVRSGRLRSGRIREPGMVENVLSPAMNDLALSLEQVREKVKNEEDKFELASYARRASEIATCAATICEQKLTGHAYWAEVTEGARATRVDLASAPVEVAPILKAALFEKPCSVILTSATLSTRAVGEEEASEHAETAFAHMMQRLGCEGAGALQLGSPFNFGRQARLIVDMAMPAPGPTSDRGFNDALAARILAHVTDTDGGAFVLFTSFASLTAAADRLAKPLADLGMPMIVHGRDGSRSQLIRQFRADERSVLLGADSFWQGVDIRGRGLRNVIITRLPFEPPDRPLTEARAEMIRARRGDPFHEDALPRAIIRFKQGFGRLIRSASDRGQVVVLDPRLVTARYGRAFLRALPEGVEVERVGARDLD